MTIRDDIETHGRLPALIAHLFPTIGPRGKVRCPTPEHEDRNPSASLNAETGAWKCHGCGARGDAVSLYGDRLGLTDFADIAEALRGAGFLPPGDGPAPPRSPVAPRTVTPPKGPVAEVAVGPRPGIMPPDDAPRDIPPLTAWPPTADVLNALGWVRSGDVVRVPVVNGSGVVCGVKVRGGRGRDGRVRTFFEPCRSGTQDPGVIVTRDIIGGQRGRLAFVVEGESDMAAVTWAATAEGVRVPVVTSSNGATSGLPGGGAALLAGYRVAVIYDADAAGVRGATAVADELAAAGIPVTVLDLWDAVTERRGRDLRDYLAHGGTVATLIDAAERALAGDGPGDDDARHDDPPADWWEDRRLEPLDVPDAMTPLPTIGVAPPMILRLVDSLAASMQIHREQVFVTIAPVLAASAGEPWAVDRVEWGVERPARVYREPCLARWALFGAGSGSRKTGTINAVTRPMREWEAARAVEFRADEIEWRGRKDALIQQRKRALSDIEHLDRGAEWEDAMAAIREIDMALEFEAPAELRVIEDNVTPEQFLVVSCQSPIARSIIAHEGRGMASIIMGGYAGRTQEAMILPFADGLPGGISRRNNDTQIHSPRLVGSLLMALQPDVLNGMMGSANLRSSGFLSRCSVVRVPGYDTARNLVAEPAEPDAAAEAWWGRVIDALLTFAAMRPEDEEDEAAGGDDEPTFGGDVHGIADNDLSAPTRPRMNVLTLTGEAFHEFIVYEQWCEEMRAATSGESGPVSGMIEKQAMAALRLAALYHLTTLAHDGLLSRAANYPIPVECVRWATAAQDWLAEETRRAMEVTICDTPELVLARRIASIMRDRLRLDPSDRSMTPPEMRDIIPGAEVSVVEAALRTLVRFGYCRMPRDESRYWRERTVRYEFHPGLAEMSDEDLAPDTLRVIVDADGRQITLRGDTGVPAKAIITAPQAALSTAQQEEVFLRYGRGETQGALATEYGVSVKTVSRTVKRVRAAMAEKAARDTVADSF